MRKDGNVSNYIIGIRKELDFRGRAENRLRYYKRKCGAPEAMAVVCDDYEDKRRFQTIASVVKEMVKLADLNKAKKAVQILFFNDGDWFPMVGLRKREGKWHYDKGPWIRIIREE